MPELRDGQTHPVQGSTRSWEIKRVGDVYSCSCPAWRNQSRNPNYRTCKHIQAFRGSDAEEQRINPHMVPLRPTHPVLHQSLTLPRAVQPSVQTTESFRQWANQKAASLKAAPAPPERPRNAWDRLVTFDPVFDTESVPETPTASEEDGGSEKLSRVKLSRVKPALKPS
jgi:DNA ligase-1